MGRVLLGQAKGSIWLKWRRLLQPNRTLSEIEFEFLCLDTRPQFKYQELSAKVRKLARLGMSDADIARRLHVDAKTVKKAKDA